MSAADFVDTGRDMAMEAVAYQHINSPAHNRTISVMMPSKQHFRKKPQYLEYFAKNAVSIPAHRTNTVSEASEREEEEDEEEEEEQLEEDEEEQAAEEDADDPWNPDAGELNLDLIKHSYAQMLLSSGLRLPSAAVAKRIDGGGGGGGADDDAVHRFVVRLRRQSAAPCADCERRSRRSRAGSSASSSSGNASGGAATVCRRCRAARKREAAAADGPFSCDLCLCDVRGVSVACLSCGHGGHLRHLRTWHRQGRRRCANRACDCVCTDFGAREDFSVAAAPASAAGTATTSSGASSLAASLV